MIKIAEEKLSNEKQDSIKITKTSKGYTWEIKRYYDYDRKDYKEIVKELHSIDEELIKTFDSN